MEKDHKKSFKEAIDCLNDGQQKAVTYLDGPVLVIAGPGTGKTQVLSARIGYILSNPDLQVAPHNILCLTYTDAGTIAMRNRLLQFIGPAAHRVNIYTFHSFCNEIIQSNLDYFGKRELELLSDLENVEILRKMIDELPPGNPLKKFRGDVYFEARRLRNLFNAMKQEAWTPEEISLRIDEHLAALPDNDDYKYKKANSKKGIKAGDLKQHLIDTETEKMEKLRAGALLFDRYVQILKERGRFDYSDMILWVLDAFRKDEFFLRRYQEQYLHFLVDEYQDTNGAQNEILKLLIGYWDNPDVFVVGDDDQSIYRFQGANVRNIEDFYKNYQKSIRYIALTENYRSSQKILDASKALIDNNKERLTRILPGLAKDLKASNPEFADSEVTIKLTEYANTVQEEAGIVKEIIRLRNKGANLSEVAVIYSKHKIADDIIKVLEQKGIPYNISKRINILELPFIEKLANLLRYIQLENERPFSGEHLLFGILNYDFWDIDATDILKLAVMVNGKKQPHRHWRELITDDKALEAAGLNSGGTVKRLAHFLNEIIGGISNMTVQQLFEKLINQAGIIKYITGSGEKYWLMDVLTSFFNFLKSEHAKKPGLKLKTLLDMLDLMQENNIHLQVNRTVYDKDGVNFVTAHSSKGLEYKHVYLAGCTKDAWEGGKKGNSQFSYPETLTRSNEGSEEEERRRLFYVAMTRAKEYLHFSFSNTNNTGKLQEKTAFLDEIAGKTEIEYIQASLGEEDIFEYHLSLLSEAPANNFEKVEKRYIEQLLEGFKMNATHLNKYLRCPVAFYYENVLKIPVAKNDAMAFGTAIHNTLQRFFDKMKQHPANAFPSKETLVQLFTEAMEKQRDAYTEEGFERRIQHGEMILPELYEQYAHEWHKIVVLEYYIGNVHIDGIPITGMLDKLEFEGKDVNVVDYKTGNAQRGLKKLEKPNDKDPLGGDYWRQLVFYKILLDADHRKKWNMISGEIDFVEKDEKAKKYIKHKLVIAPEDMEIVRQQIREVYEKILNQEFSEGCNDDYCQWCDFVKTKKQVKINGGVYKVPVEIKTGKKAEGTVTKNKPKEGGIGENLKLF